MGFLEISLDRIATAESFLSNVRDALHEVSGRDKDLLLLTEQDKVARYLEFKDADHLMLEVAKSARAVDYVMDFTWHRIDTIGSGAFFKKRKRESLGKGIQVFQDEVVLEFDYDIKSDPGLGLRAAALSAQNGVPLSVEACVAMAANFVEMPAPWPKQSQKDLVALIGAGEQMVRTFEALDQEGLIEKWIPEWSGVRFLPQRNVLHRHTVDRHMLETAVKAAALTRTVHRPDLLLVAALFHDIGKGNPTRDHSEYGDELIQPLALRLGFSEADSKILALLVREHLLLSSIATKRDLNDPQTIAHVLSLVPDAQALELLHALSIADGEATGKAAWSKWKANLVADLVSRCLAMMSGITPAIQVELTERQLIKAAQGAMSVELVSQGDIFEIEIVSPDSTGLLSRVAGVLSISRLNIRSARTRTVAGCAVMTWLVELDTNAPIPTSEILEQLLRRVAIGELDLTEKIDERIRQYKKFPGIPTPLPIVSAVNDEATDATILEVRMHDRPGVLYNITKVISRFGVDIRTAIVSTLGAEALDTLYVTDLQGSALTEERAKLLANQVENYLLTQ